MKNSIKKLIILITILFTINVYAEDGWITEDGNTYYYENNEKVSGFKEIDGKLYFFSRNDFTLKHGWLAAYGERWYQNEEGEVLRGIQTIDNDSYYFNNEGFLKNGFITIDGKIYFFSRNDNTLKKGWQAAYGKRWYQNENGELVTGIQTIDNEKYYFDEEGFLSGGFVKEDGKIYFFSRNDYSLKKGWQAAYGKRWYQNEEGELVTGIQTIDNEKYYFDEEGFLSGGFVKEDGKIYFFSRNDYSLKKGWQAAYGERWYQNEDGEVLRGIQKIGKETYYFNEDGFLRNGFITIDGKKYFFSRNDNTLKKGWQAAYGERWYQNENGELVVGKQIIDGKKYFFSETGMMQTGFIRDDQENLLYYYKPTDGSLNVGWTTTDRGPIYQDEFGVVNEETGLVTIDGKEYFFEDMYAQTGVITIDNKDYYFNEKTYNKEYNNCETKYKKYYLNKETGEVNRIQQKPVYSNQKDSRWSNIKIGLAYFGTTGCVPTSLAMAYTSIKEREILPIEVGRYLYENTDQFNKRLKGASGKAVIYASNHYGISYKNIYTKEDLINELEKGRIIYGTMQNGKFATPRWNHAILIYDYSNDKVKTIASDPLNTYNNGWVDIDLIWNEKNTDPDDLTGGSALYSLS